MYMVIIGLELIFGDNVRIGQYINTVIMISAGWKYLERKLSVSARVPWAFSLYFGSPSRDVCNHVMIGPDPWL